MKTTDLPFVVVPVGHPIELWVVRPTGDWGQDCATGALYAADLCQCMKETGNTALLGQVVEVIVAAGQWTGIEVGFFQGIAGRAAG